MKLNEDQLRILQLIQLIEKGEISLDGKVADTIISESLNLSINSVRYYIEELEKSKYIDCQYVYLLDGQVEAARGYRPTGSSDGPSVISIWLTTKGQVAVENPEDLIQPPSPVMNNFHISGSVNAPISILQDSNNNTLNITQNVDQSVTEVLNSIDYLSQAIQDFPEDDKEIATVHLDDLKKEFQEPEQRNPKKIRAYFLAFLGIALPLLSYVTNATDFFNNLTDLSDKFNIELPQINISK